MPRKSDACWVDRSSQIVNGLSPKYSFDSKKWQLGSLCKNFCIFPGTTQSLRSTYKIYGPVKKGASRSVNKCACARYGKDWLFNFLDQSSIGIDTSKYRLGSLCKNKHNWKKTNKSLRWAKSNKCLDCDALRRQDPQRKQMQAELNKRWYQLNKELTNERSKRNLAARKAKNPFEEKLKRAINKHKRKARFNEAHTTQITSKDIKAHVSVRHQDACVYCGAKSNIVHDHFIPLAKGGPHVLGNIVPACQHCNSSKRDKDPKQWYFEQPFATKKGWQKILKLLNLAIKKDATQLSLL